MLVRPISNRGAVVGILVLLVVGANYGPREWIHGPELSTEDKVWHVRNEISPVCEGHARLLRDGWRLEKAWQRFIWSHARWNWKAEVHNTMSRDELEVTLTYVLKNSAGEPLPEESSSVMLIPPGERASFTGEGEMAFKAARSAAARHLRVSCTIR